MKLPESISLRIFRANDIRGKVETDLTPNAVYAIGRAFGTYLHNHHLEKVVVAKDGRLSSPALSDALICGLIECGLQVIDIGKAPTPLMYFATHHFQAQSGVMITGSHNPPDENGLKLISNNQVLSESDLLSLRYTILSRKFHDGLGTRVYLDAAESYFREVTSQINLKKSLRVVVDCGNGIVGAWFPELARRLGCEVIESCCEVDGTFPNHFPDPSIPANLKSLIDMVRKSHADVGLAFDGDGDRLGVVTNDGEIIWPDRLLMLFSKVVLQSNLNAKIVYDVKCTRELNRWIKSHGGIPVMWKTGHSLIKSKLKEIGGALAGEMSGHFYFKDRWYGFDDALYAGCRLLDILSATNSLASELFRMIPNSVNTPELRLAMDDNRKFEFMQDFTRSARFQNGEWSTIDGVRIDFAHGFGLVRASNTSPYLILRFEADTNENLTQIQELFRNEILKVDPKLTMPF